MKVSDYVLRNVNRNVRNFVDEATIIFNFGKYSAQVVGSPPQWVARNGEFVFFASGGLNRIYFYSSDQWNWIGGGPGGGGVPGGDDTQVQVNSQGTFYADSGLTYIANSSLRVRSDMPIVFNNGDGADNYWIYNSGTDYMELYINGGVRAQF